MHGGRSRDSSRLNLDRMANLRKRAASLCQSLPPNATGSLPMGHALPNALQDTLIIWSRMRGLTTLWLPGCDHASISTQSVVENLLWRREKKTKHDVGRQKFNESVIDWTEEYQQKINDAVRRIGASLDWSRKASTMNEKHTAATVEHFVRLHEGVIYGANRLVNWCTRLNPGLSTTKSSKGGHCWMYWDTTIKSSLGQ